VRSGTCEPEGTHRLTGSATSLADYLGIDFALINRNRRREQRLHSAHLHAHIHRESAAAAGTASEIANGVHSLSSSGEWFINEEGGRRLLSGGNRGRNNEDSEDEKDAKMELLVGDVTGRTVILLDDMVDTGRTLALASKTLEEAGARRIFAITTHALLSGRAIELIKRLNLERLVVTNTICNLGKARECGGKLEILDMSAVIGETIRRAHHGESISTMFRQDAEMMF